MGVCNCSMFCCSLVYVHSSIAIILMGKRELVALLNLSSWCLVMVERLFLAMPRGCLRFVVVVFPDHTHLLFLIPRLFSFKRGGNDIGTGGQTDGKRDWNKKNLQVSRETVYWSTDAWLGVKLTITYFDCTNIPKNN